MYVMKSAGGEYIDVRTMRPIDVRVFLHNIISTGHKASFAEVKNNIPKLTELTKAYKEHKFNIDFETALTREGVKSASDLFSVGMAGTYSTQAGKTIRAGEIYFADIFKDIVQQDDMEKQITARGKLATSSKNIQAGYFKEITRFAKQKGIDLGKVSNLTEIVQNRDTLSRVVTALEAMGEAYTHDASPKSYRKFMTRFPNQGSPELFTGLSMADKVYSAMKDKMGFDDGTPFAAVNPQGVDDAGAALTGFSKQNSILDLRGHQLFINSTVMPNLTENLHVTLGPVVHDVAHKLRMSDQQKKAFFQKFEKGISSIYSKGSSAEDMLKNLRYANRSNRYLRLKETTHGAMMDSIDQVFLSQEQYRFMGKTMKESAFPNFKKMGARSRFTAAFIVDQATSAIADNSAQFTSKRGVLGYISKNINMTDLAEEVSGKLEYETSKRMEKNFLHSNTKQFGGNTIAQLLGGAALFSGVRMAANSAMERFMETREKSTEGIRHDSYMTQIRRLMLTDFGSGVIASHPVSFALPLLSKIFKKTVMSPTGIPRLVQKTFKNVGKIIKNNRGSGTFMEMMRDTNKRTQLIDDLFHQEGTQGLRWSVKSMYSHGHISESQFVTANKGLDTIRDKLSMYSAIAKPNLNAKKFTLRTLTDDVTNLFVSRSVENGQTIIKAKAPAVAMGVGAMGAFAIMLSRGSYDPGEMNRPVMTKHDYKYRRVDKVWNKIRTRMQDIRQINLEAVGLQSRERQDQRYSMTDFGSGLRLIGRMIGKANKYPTAVSYPKKLSEAFGKYKSLFLDKEVASRAAKLPSNIPPPLPDTRTIMTANAMTIDSKLIKKTPKPSKVLAIKKSKDQYHAGLNKMKHNKPPVMDDNAKSKWVESAKHQRDSNVSLAKVVKAKGNTPTLSSGDTTERMAKLRKAKRDGVTQNINKHTHIQQKGPRHKARPASQIRHDAIKCPKPIIKVSKKGNSSVPEPHPGISDITKRPEVYSKTPPMKSVARHQTPQTFDTPVDLVPNNTGSVPLGVNKNSANTTIIASGIHKPPMRPDNINRENQMLLARLQAHMRAGHDISRRPYVGAGLRSWPGAGFPTNT